MFGMTCPAVLILTFVTFFYKALKDNIWCNAALRGIRCAVVPIMGSAVISLGKEAFRKKMAIFVCFVAFMFCIFTDISNVLMILIGIVIALAARAVKKCKGGVMA